MTVPNGVDFGAADGEKSRLIFLLVGPESDPSGYLDMLSTLIRTLKNHPGLSDQLVAAKSSTEFLTLFRSAEEN